MSIITTPEILILAATLILTGTWAVIASILAHNRGRDVAEMAERHNSIVEALRDSTKEHRAKERELEEVYLTALDISSERLESIEKLTVDVERWKGKYTEAENRLKKFDRARDPKTGKIISRAKALESQREELTTLCAEAKANAVDDAFDAMMGNAIDQLNGLRVRNLCDEIKANATECVNTESAMNMGNSSRT